MNQLHLVTHWLWLAKEVLFSWFAEHVGRRGPLDLKVLLQGPCTTDLKFCGAVKLAYVPPTMRGVADVSRDVMRRRNDDNSVRVTNLSGDTHEPPDLLELFRAFGPFIHVYVAVDQKTGSSRGFGFVKFVHREDAEKAIIKLNGYGYDNLILRLE